MGKISTLSFTCAKLSTLIEPLCCTTLTLLVRLRPVLVCPQSWSLPHLSSSPLLCLLTLSLPPPPPCVEMVHIMCLQAHAYRQWPPHIDTQHNIRNPHVCMALHTFTQHTITHAHSNNLMQCTETACHNTRSCHFGTMVITEFKL